MKITVKVDGKLVAQGLQDLKAEVPLVGRRGLRTAMERIKREMQAYPPEPDGQSIEESHSKLGKIFKPAKGRYRRTGNFGASWTIVDGGIGSTGYSLENTAQRKGKKYGQYVVGDAYGTGQAWMHKGRWPLFRDVVDAEVNRLPDDVTELIRMVGRRYTA